MHKADLCCGNNENICFCVGNIGFIRRRFVRFELCLTSNADVGTVWHSVCLPVQVNWAGVALVLYSPLDLVHASLCSY